MVLCVRCHGDEPIAAGALMFVGEGLQRGQGGG